MTAALSLDPIEEELEPPSEEDLLLLSPDELRKWRKLMSQRRLRNGGKMRPAMSFRQFVDRVSGGRYKWYRYAEVMCGVLQTVADGKRKRVMVFAPPRHGKSEPVSRLFPAYYLYRHPEHWVALLSYGAELAQTLSRAARANYTAGVGLLSQEAAAMRQWETGQGGGLWATGFAGPGLGKGFHLGIIDDPYKNAEEAGSVLLRDRFRDWYSSTFYTRREPGAAIVIVMQRWDDEDLAGWLLQQERELEEEERLARESNEAETDLLSPVDLYAERWHVVNFEAIRLGPQEEAEEVAKSGRSLWPSTVTVEPDWRRPGEALAPERYDIRELRRIERRLGPYFFGALFQQRPGARKGKMFALDAFEVIDPDSWEKSGAEYVRWWDFAGSEKKRADWTVGALMVRTRAGLFAWVDVTRGQWAHGKRNQIILATAEEDKELYGSSLVTWAEVEGGSAGLEQRDAFIKLLEGFAVYAEHSTGSKEANAEGLASSAANGNVKMVRAPWNGALRREAVDFPNGAHDDMIDAGSKAYNKLSRRGRKFAAIPGTTGA